MRDDLRTAIEQGGRQPGRRAVEAVERALDPTEIVEAGVIGSTYNADVVALLTDRRLLIGGGVTASYTFGELRGAVTYQAGTDTVFLPLLEDDAGEPFLVPQRLGEAFATSVRTRIAATTNAAASPWADPSFTTVLRLETVGLLAAPPESPFPIREWATATLVSVGVVLRAKKTDARLVIPWRTVHAVRVEGVDQITNRPSVGAVVAFGVLGLAARRTERRAFVALETTAGEYVLEDDDHLPVELRPLLAPFVDRLGVEAEPPRDSGHDESSDPIEQIRRLGELRDAGYITAEQFEAKRDELLRRI